MTNLARRLADHLFQIDTVINEFQDSHIRLSRYILSECVESKLGKEPNWRQLLSWASVFSQSDLDIHLELSIAAAIAALLTAETESEMAHQAAIFILESCSNTPTVSLAQKRGLAEPLKSQKKLLTIIKNYQRRLQHIIFDDFTSSVLPVTDFQERIWDTLGNKKDTALTAPTSAGKSYVLMRWLAQSLLKIGKDAVVAYIVPSRALIGQVRRSIEEMLLKYNIRPRISTLPTLYQQEENRQTILVMTQERIERLFAVNGNLRFNIIVVDEAHKLGEGPRGVILQRVIDESLKRFKNCKVILAAPHANNAEVLLPYSDKYQMEKIKDNIVSDSRPTVLQNLFWVTPVKRRKARWNISLIKEKKIGEIGELKLKGGPTGKKKRLSAIAFQLGGKEGGNIVFTNGAAEAEEVALLLREHVESSSKNYQPEDENIELAKLIKDAVHESYPLGETLPFGIGIHYGDMPEISRREQERLFDEGKLLFLVCTSTLLEGVNLPCRNLFIWGPRQGRGNPMSEHAFWNLAGRAGRWGREFAGNVFCIDVYDKKQWPHGPPSHRQARAVDHSGSILLGDIENFKLFVESSDPVSASQANRYFEQILGELVSTKLDGRNLSSIGWARWCSNHQLKTLDDIVESSLKNITAPPELIRRHSGINPILISQFLEKLETLPESHAEHLMPMSPDMPDALSVLSDNLKIIDAYLGGQFGNQKQRNLKSKLTIEWIRGLPLGRIIDERINFLSSKKQIRIPAEIRSIIELINKNARYLIPKYLSCYADCISYWFSCINRDDLKNEINDIQDMLETGVTERTMIALIGLGLSRTAAIEISAKITDTELSIEGAIEWLKNRPLEAYNVSPVIIREVKRVLGATEFL